LDYFHTVDQNGRYFGLDVFGFNGTGGVWRQKAVDDTGGWIWDTVTEDLDMSYKAAVAGYDFIYLRHCPQQLEIPANIRAHRMQKHRWTKGFMQVLRKRGWDYLTSDKLDWRVKVEAWFHFTMAMPYFLSIIFFFLSPIISYFNGWTVGLSLFVGLFPGIVHFAGIFLTIYTKTSSSNGHYKTFWQRTKRVIFVPVQITFAWGMMVMETAALIDGLLTDDATFKRTPKEGSKRLAIYIDEDDSVVVDEEEENEDIEKAVTKPVKKRSFENELVEALAGIAFAAYIMIWSIVISQKAETDVFTLFAGIIIPLFPIIGLLYMHGSFLLVIIQTNYQKWKETRAERGVDLQSGANVPEDTSGTLDFSDSVDIEKVDVPQGAENRERFWHQSIQI
jgi:hypothetical protein